MSVLAVILLATRLCVGLTIGAAAWTKLTGRRRLDRFAASLMALRLVEASSARRVALIVGCSEVVVAVALMTPSVDPRLAGASGAALLAALTVGLWQVVRTGTEGTCACFGASRMQVGPFHLVRNVILLAAATIVCVLPQAAWQVGDTALAAGFAVLACLVIVNAEDLFDLFRPARRPTLMPEY